MKNQFVFVLAIVVACGFAWATVVTDLEITPIEDFEPSGLPGGPFTPSSKDYQLRNIGPNSLFWGVYITADWLDLWPWWGELEPNQSTIVGVSLTPEANLLPEGVYNDTLTFVDISSEVEQTRGATLTIAIPEGIWVSPNSFDVNLIEGCMLTEVLTIGNQMDEELTFTIQTNALTGAGQPPLPPAGGRKGGQTTTSAKSESPSMLEGHDFTVPGNAPYKPGELLVRFARKGDGKHPAPQEKVQILNSLGGGTIKRNFKIVPGLSTIELPAGMSVEQALQRFNKAKGILYAQPNYQLKATSTFPDDPRFDELWGMHNTGQSGGMPDADIDAPEAWDFATGSSKVIVAVIDSGVDYTHPDLAANMWVNQEELNGTPGQDDDGNGYIDDIYGYDFCNNDGNPMDDFGHGTHCAGIIGAVGDNAEGVTGVCWDVKIMALKFLDSDGYGWSSDAIASLEYSVLMGANVSSNSYGGGGYEQAFKDAVNAAGAAGMLFVAAAGNDYWQNNDVFPHYPSSYDCDSIIAVLSTDDEDLLSSFSNYGPTSVDIGAPGSSILSCQLSGGYKYDSGTSMATPHVAGACALVWSINPVLGNSEVKDILLQSVDKTLPTRCVSEGRLNLHRAVLQTQEPWVAVEPESGTIGPGDSNDVNVTFRAIDMTPGTYDAEIVILANDPYRPTTIVPVTMTVTPDDLVVSPNEGIDSNGIEGGPFTPQCVTYTLINNGTEPVSWTTTETENWFDVDPNQGVLNPAASIDVNVCIAPDANLLDSGVYSQTLTFRNEDSNSIKRRSITLTITPPDCFTECFDTNESDLACLSVTFIPDGSAAYYQACRDEVTQFPTDPNGGTYVPLGDDDFAEIILSDCKEVLFHGIRYDRFYIGSNGYITFGLGDTEFLPSLDAHFSMPRISAMFEDLTPADSCNISFDQLDDRAVVTFKDVPLYGDKEAKSSFQIEMFFVDGAIRITWLGLAAAAPLTGLSKGDGIPALFTESDLSEYPPCWPLGDLNGDYSINFGDFGLFAPHWRESGCGVPQWCGKADLNHSGTTDFNDLALLGENWLAKVDWWLQPISHWEFDEGQGNIAYDSIGQNHGTIYDANWTNGIFDEALSFDGDGDYVDLGNDDSLKTPLPVTIAAWIRVFSEGTAKYMFRIDGKASGYCGIWFDVGATGKLEISYGDCGGTGGAHRRSKIGTNSLNANTWYHVAAVIRGPTDMSIYVNGMDDAGTYSGSGGDLAYSTATSLIGTRHDFSVFYDGKIDDVRVYDRALPAGEILQLYLDGLGGKAYHPNPPDQATDIDPNTVLSWSPGEDALSHNVYLGTDYNEVSDANTSDLNVYKGNQAANSYNPGGLELATTYYWRIDEVGLYHVSKGDVWSFTTWSQWDPNLGLISWWQFNEGQGSTAYDSIGENHGTIHDATWMTGIIGGALNFDGYNDYVDLGNDSSLKPPLPVTISTWIRLSSLGANHYIIGLDDQSIDYYGVWWYVLSTNNLLISYGDGQGRGPTHIRNKVGTTAFNADTWYHIAAVIRGPADISLYVDGVDDEGTYSGTGGALAYYFGTAIIGMQHTLEFSFGGGIDDVRVYGRALAASEIWRLYQNGLN